MRYEGPIYRPPSEADSLLIQATVGCPHNKCTFCMVYKNTPGYKVRPIKDICEDMDVAAKQYGKSVSTLFFPAGNSIAMRTDDLAAICSHAHDCFPNLQRITVYGSFQYIHAKGPQQLQKLAKAGLSRIHVGLETGNDAILKAIQKGTNALQQQEAGIWVREAGIELSLYVLLGIGGTGQTREHAMDTARVLNRIQPAFIRLRTFLPKINTPLLDDIEQGRFAMLGPHGILEETRNLIAQLTCTSQLTSDHYTNYVNLYGDLPQDIPRLLAELDAALQRPESSFRPIYIGNQ